MLFSNMTDAQKQQCLEKYRYINVEHGSCWDEALISIFKEEMAAKGFEGVKVRHSGSFCSQGDGASFTFTALNNEVFFKGVFENPNTPEIQKDFLRGVKYSGTPNDHYYVHENSVSVRVDFDYINEDNDLPNLQAIAFETMVQEFIVSESTGLARDLSRAYDSAIEDEAIAETLEANEYNFNVYDMSIRDSADQDMTVKEQAALLISAAKVMIAHNVSAACACGNEYDGIRRGHLMAEGIDRERADNLLEVELSQMVE